ncbi:hypothetical protein [Rhizobium sp. SYY.PMSO]|uniref:hypothetical protein n=1 Tax=Rhizobium sp. SYY.PMSO TaxID=3382192 RepID=UPI00398FA429
MIHKAYFPITYIDVPASEPHPANTYYRVSMGIEHWDNEEPRYVYKIQMVFNGVVVCDTSPFYPQGSGDFSRIIDAISTIRKGGGRNGRGMMTATGDQPGMLLQEMEQMLKMYSI